MRTWDKNITGGKTTTYSLLESKTDWSAPFYLPVVFDAECRKGTPAVFDDMWKNKTKRNHSSDYTELLSALGKCIANRYSRLSHTQTINTAH